MANQEQLDRLRIQGARMWNQWRARNPDVQIDLSNTTFSGAILRSAILSNANLSNVYLNDAILEFTDLHFANLSNTTFSGVYLSNVNLSGANLSNAIILSAFFGAVDLSTVKGLETVKHHAPSTIGFDTIIRSQGKIPEIFLRNAGIPATNMLIQTGELGRAVATTLGSHPAVYVLKRRRSGRWPNLRARVGALEAKGTRKVAAPAPQKATLK